MARFTPADQSVSDVVNDPAQAEAVEGATQPSRTETIAERLAERLGAIARATSVFGEPVVRGSVTVIPVARARTGFGGGTGGDAEGSTGEGGGGGAMVTPVGWIEITDSGSRFRPLAGRSRLIAPLIAAAAVVAGIMLRERKPAARRPRMRIPRR